jgi:hypothetical protein
MVIIFLLFILAIPVALVLLWYCGWLIQLLVLFGIALCFVIIIVAVVSAIILLLAVPYYLLTKRPEVQDTGDYKLEDIKE